MYNYLNPEGYAKIQKKLDEAYELYQTFYRAVNKAHVTALADQLDRYGQLADLRSRIVSNMQRTQELQQQMAVYLTEYQAAAARGEAAFSANTLNSYIHGAFGTFDVNTAIDYSQYKTYHYANSGQSFLEDYNDLNSFFNTQIYKDAAQKVSYSEWSNTDLWLGKYDDYTNAMLESSMASILESIPGIEPEIDADDVLDQLGDMLGVDNVDKYLSLLKTILSESAKNQVPFDVLKEYETVQAILEMFPPEERGTFTNLLANVYNTTVMAGRIDDITKACDVLDIAVDSLAHAYNNYAAQLAYLDSMETALVNAGYSQGPVIEMIGELKKKYSDEVYYALSEVGDYVVKEVSKQATKTLISNVGKFVPLVKDINFGLKIVDTASDIMFANEISAYKGLSGLRQYDEVLSKSYESYVQMMNDGVATAADMAEADRILSILTATKAREYEYMMKLCYQNDLDLYVQYKHKYEALTDEDQLFYNPLS